MSWQTNEWVRITRVGDPILKLLLMMMSNRANGDGELWPSQQVLAWDTEIPERTLRRKLNDLVEMGLIEIVPRVRPDGTKSTNMIRLLFDPEATVAGGEDHRPKSGVTTGQNRGSPSANMVAGQESSGIVKESPESISADDDMNDGRSAEVTPSVPAKPDYGHIFDTRFWPEYPKRAGNQCKAEGRKKFIALCQKGANPEKLIAAARAQREFHEREGKIGTSYVPMVTTWFNQRRWDDDPPVADPGGKPPGGGGGFLDLARDMESKQ